MSRRRGMKELRDPNEGDDGFLKNHDGFVTVETEQGVHNTTYSTTAVV